MLRVQHLAGYGLEIPNIEEACRFFCAFGLERHDIAGRVEFRSRDLLDQPESPAEIVVLQGPVKRLHHLSFAIRVEDAPAFARHLSEMGVAPSDPPFGNLRKGLWFVDPWGTWVNLVPVEGRIYAREPELVHQRVDRHHWREISRTVRPNRLGHLLMYTQDYEQTEKFYTDALGLMTSDRALGKVSFMAAGQGVRDHHCFGLINGTHRGVQHSSFQVDSIDAIGMGAMQMRAAGYTEGFGVGRHALASNLFYYTRDPWGSWIEYYADMDKISDDWKSGDWQELPYIWPEWAPEFWTNEMNANHEPR